MYRRDETQKPAGQVRRVCREDSQQIGRTTKQQVRAFDNVFGNASCVLIRDAPAIFASLLTPSLSLV